MNCEIQNLTRRPVSIHCNSGKTYHLPPGYKHELPQQEVIKNFSIKKLQERKIISIRELSPNSIAKSATKKTVRQEGVTEAAIQAQGKTEGGASAKKSRKK